jgi:hypothetical protein
LWGEIFELWVNKIFFAFSTLLDGLAPILAMFLLDKQKKKKKIGSHYCTSG